MDDQTKQCPQCKGTVSQNAQECPLCGVIFKRYEETRDRLKKTAISAYENGDLPNSRKLFKTLIEHFPDLTDLAQSYLKGIEDQESNHLYQKALSEEEEIEEDNFEDKHAGFWIRMLSRKNIIIMSISIIILVGWIFFLIPFPPDQSQNDNLLSIDKIIDIWGYPDEAFKAPNNNNVYVYVERPPIPPPQLFGQSWDGYISPLGSITLHKNESLFDRILKQRLKQMYCKWYFEFSSEGKIVKISTKGNYCKQDDVNWAHNYNKRIDSR